MPKAGQLWISVQVARAAGLQTAERRRLQRCSNSFDIKALLVGPCDRQAATVYRHTFSELQFSGKPALNREHAIALTAYGSLDPANGFNEPGEHSLQ